MKITLAQLNFTVGDFKNNSKKIADVIRANSNSDLIVFPELCVCGYPPEDVVLREEFLEKSDSYASALIAKTLETNCAILISTPWVEDGKIYNCSLIAEGGKVIHKQYKYDLPNYGIFDEKRVFSSGAKPELFTFRDRKVGMLICEDIWDSTNASELVGADFILSINASPFERKKHKSREIISTAVAKLTGAPVFYVNQVCGHDDLVFDGGSFVINKEAKIVHSMKYFEEEVKTFTLKEVKSAEGKDFPVIDENKHIYNAMVLGLRDYINKNGFPGVLLGLSGGVDSALSAVVAVDAIGKENVRLVMLPSKYTSSESKEDAEKLAKNLGIKLEYISIEKTVTALEETLAGTFEGKKADITEENLQSRARGVILMAMSNKFGHMVLSTGNKSEMAVGYATLYGDMCGGYNVLKDTYKTKVFELCEWKNKQAGKDLIPQNIITKAPSAELRENQKDQDSLPPYDMLDQILHAIIEEDFSTEEIAKRGFDVETIVAVEKMVHRAEYKRRQSAPGVKISSKPFGRDRRYPITNKYY